MLSNILSRFKSAWAYALAHKVISTIVLLVVLYGGYHYYGVLTTPPTATRYVTSIAATSTVVSSLTETGQVSASQQITLSPKASGTVIGVYVKPGDHVYAGQIIAQLDATDAIQSLQSAKLSYQHALLSYQQTTATSTLALNLIVAKNGATNAQISLQKTHDATYTSVASIYSDLGTIITGLDNVLHSSNVSGRANQKNIDAYTDLVLAHDQSIAVYKNSADTSYTAAYTAYTNAVAAYKATSSGTISNDDLVTLAQSTYTATQAVSEAVRNSHDFFDRVTSDYSLYNLGSSPVLAGLLSSTNTYTSTVSSDLGSALSAQSSLVSAEQALAQAQNTLQSTEGGSNTLTVQSADLSLQQAKDSVTSAQTAVANYSVIAPFGGTIAAVGVQKYDQAGSGTSVATLVTNENTANVTVNEIDASKIKTGQKAMLTFDALPDVSIAGTVASIDSVGTVSQGVVSYNVVIGFDTRNASVMPGMSVTASIITRTETGLVVPASAVKTSGSENYILVFDPALDTSGSSTSGTVTDRVPSRVVVTIGATDNMNTVILSGIRSDEQVVAKTSAVTPQAKSATKTTTGTRPGMGGGMGVPGL